MKARFLFFMVHYMLERKLLLDKIKKTFDVNRIVCLLGPRQCGKTTLAKKFCTNLKDFPKSNYFDLENPIDAERLQNPKLALENLNDLIVIDEIQRIPELFPVLRYIHDEYPEKTFLILGSASKELISQTSESLAGRISYIEITPFMMLEIAGDYKKLWLRGGYPKSFLATQEENSLSWRYNYIRTYAEHDLAAIGININSEKMRRLWAMLAHYHGNILNCNSLAGSLDITAPTVKHYIDLLSATFMLRVLQPYHTNIKKRQVKSPKIYCCDTGILHALLNIVDNNALLTSPKLGASWEGFALEQVVHLVNPDNLKECYFWSTHNNAELDLIVIGGNKKFGFEFKYMDAPKLTPSMKIALEDLKLDEITVIYPGDKDYEIHQKVRAVGLENFVTNFTS